MWIIGLLAVAFLFTFRRVRVFATCTLVVLVIFMLPGMADNPGLAWALIFAVAAFCMVVFSAVYFLHLGQKKRRENEKRAEVNAKAAVAATQVQKTFGKFHVRN